MIHHVEIVKFLKTQRIPLENEKVLQAEIAQALIARFPAEMIEREQYLDPENVIDILVDGAIGIEIKIKGSKRDIHRQCARYCAFARIQVLILVTNVSLGFPEEINGKPCYVVKLGRAWL